MKVKGITIEQEVIDAAIARMKTDGFTAKELEAFIGRRIERTGEVPNRAADRLIQQQRKAGNISFGGGYWVWCRKGSK